MKMDSITYRCHKVLQIYRIHERILNMQIINTPCSSNIVPLTVCIIFVLMQDNSPVTQITNDAFAAVRIPEFKNLMLGRFTFIMSLRMMGTLVGWWVYELTNDPLAIGLVGLSEFLPAFSFALYAGHVIDKSEKRKLMLKGVSFYTLAALLLIIVLH